MSKNTRWALAIVGVVIIIVAAVVIGTGKDNTDATPVPDNGTETTSQTGSTPSTGGSTGGTGNAGGQGSGGSNQDSGGSSPGDNSSGDESGGASPQEETGGAKAQIGVVSPVLTAPNPRTVKADKGETVVIRARSDQAATLHIHGYDKHIELKPGKTGRVKFKATIDGEFAIEFHYAGSEAEAGTLRVSP